jgi:uncharacterized Ntn-hydrolase superfamily protein
MKISTYTIVARDPETGMLGVAGGTNWFCYGRWVPHIEAGFGALATQAEVNMWYAPNGIQDLMGGKTAQVTLDDVLKRSPDLDGVYQLLIIDNKGNVACHTGDHNHDFAGHICEPNLGVAGNTLVSRETLTEVVREFKSNQSPFGLRLIKALQAGQKAGGDIRGMKSAALKVAMGTNTGEYWSDIIYDLRVDESSNPLKELERLYTVAEAYSFIDKAESTNDSFEALKYYLEGLKLDPNNSEIMFWLARTYANLGDTTNSEKYRTKLKDYPGKWEEYWKRLG